MMPVRSIVLLSMLLAACKPDAPPPAAEARPEAKPAKPPGSVPTNFLPPGDPHAAPAPGEDEALIPPPPSAPGTFEATIDGKLTHFLRLPPSQNRAVVLPEDGVTRVSLGAVEGDGAGPRLRMLLGGVRPDQVEYPLTIPAKVDAKAKKAKATGDQAKADAGPTVSLRYEVNDKRVYVINPDKGAEVHVTLEGYEGTTLRGSFEGKLAPTAAGLGEPIPISGKFAVELGLRNVEPGPAAPDAAKAPSDALTLDDAKVPGDAKPPSAKPPGAQKGL